MKDIKVAQIKPLPIKRKLSWMVLNPGESFFISEFGEIITANSDNSGKVYIRFDRKRNLLVHCDINGEGIQIRS